MKVAAPKLKMSRLTHSPVPPEACVRVRTQAAEKSVRFIEGIQVSGGAAGHWDTIPNNPQWEDTDLLGKNIPAKPHETHIGILNMPCPPRASWKLVAFPPT